MAKNLYEVIQTETWAKGTVVVKVEQVNKLGVALYTTPEGEVIGYAVRLVGQKHHSLRKFFGRTLGEAMKSLNTYVEGVA